MGTLLVIVLLSNQGYWVGGTEQSVRLKPTLLHPAAAGMPAANLRWELRFGSVHLAEGTVAVDGAGAETELKIICPEVRARAQLQLVWRVEARDGRALLADGMAGIQAFPSAPAVAWPRLVTGRRVFVIDPAGGLATVLVNARVPATKLSAVSRLRLEKPDIVLVAPDALEGGQFEQAPLLAVARAGAAVIVFRQSRTDQVAGVRLVTRSLPRRLEWSVDHPLLASFDRDDLASWRAGLPDELLALRLTGGQPAMPLIQWPVEAQGGALPAVAFAPKATHRVPEDAVPLNPAAGGMLSDLLLMVKPVGAGSMVLCQLPMGDWEKDAHARLFLGAALEYLAGVVDHPVSVDVSSIPVDGRPMGSGHGSR